MARYESILETVGRTPAVRVKSLAPNGVNLWVKVEAFNPMGSVKDRMALAVIEDAERSGRLKPGQTVIEATSGNTGIGLAMVCAAKGYPLVVTMAENFSVERRKLMRFLGAKVVLTPAGERGTGMLNKAVELAETHGWFLCRQFENEANADVHSRTTAREILADFEGERLDAFVTGFGTGGTLKGVGRVLKQERPDTRILVCEPENSRLLADAEAQPRNPDGSASGSHPGFRPHVVQGWAPDFVAKLAEDAMNGGFVDGFVPVDGDAAIDASRELAAKEGIFTGISGGATLAGAIAVCHSLPPGSNVLCMLPDTGERYLTTPLFDGIAEEMTEDEIAISKSTPSSRFDKPAVSPTEEGVIESRATPEARQFVETAIADSDKPVVMFAFEYCEFCWSARKMLDACGIEYTMHVLDAGDFQKDAWGDAIRAALQVRTGFKTIPQLFVAGEFIGGCTEQFDAWIDGSLQQALQRVGVEFKPDAASNPYGFLPAWLHSRQSADDDAAAGASCNLRVGQGSADPSD